MADPATDAEASHQKSPAQIMLERIRANSVRFRTLVRELDQAMDSIKRGRASTDRPPAESPPATTAAATLFDGLEMLITHDEQTASELEQRVKELRALF